MLLAIDVGNTNIVVGVFEGSTLVESWRLATDNRRSADEYGTILGSMYRRINITEEDMFVKTHFSRTMIHKFMLERRGK